MIFLYRLNSVERFLLLKAKVCSHWALWDEDSIMLRTFWPDLSGKYWLNKVQNSLEYEFFLENSQRLDYDLPSFTLVQLGQSLNSTPSPPSRFPGHSLGIPSIQNKQSFIVNSDTFISLHLWSAYEYYNSTFRSPGQPYYAPQPVH